MLRRFAARSLVLRGLETETSSPRYAIILSNLRRQTKHGIFGHSHRSYSAPSPSPPPPPRSTNAAQASSASSHATLESSLDKDILERLSFIVQPRLDFRGMADALDEHVCNTRERRMDHVVNVEHVVSLYRKSNVLETRLNDLRHLRKAVSEVMMPKGKKGKSRDEAHVDTDSEMADEASVCRLLEKLLFMDNSQTEDSKDTSQLDVEHLQVDQELKNVANEIISSAKEDIGLVTVHLATHNASDSAKQRMTVNQEAKKLWVTLGRLLKQEIAQKEIELVQLKDTVQEMGKKVPNLSLPQVPCGEDPAVLKVVGEKPLPDSLPDAMRELFEPGQVERSFLPHEEVGALLDLFDFESAALCSGSRFFYLKNEAVLLELALTNYAISKVIAKGFTPHTVPELVRRPIIEGCGFQPRGEGSQIYHIEGSDLSLIGTSEIALAGLNANKILNEEVLPMKVAATSHCFRTEAGSGGKQGGLYRVHQFTKVEMFVFCKPEQSEQAFEDVVRIQEEIFAELGFHFKVLEMPAHDLGAPAARKVDIEAYMPARQEYGELSSSSNCTDYQSRRLFTRFRDIDSQQNRYVHTINGTALAIPRVILTILEHFQYRRKDNGLIGVVIPPVLRPYMGGMTHIEQKPAT